MSSSIPPSKYTFGSEVILVEPNSIDQRSNKIKIWSKTKYRVMEKEYNRERTTWIYKIEPIDPEGGLAALMNRHN